ncbi:MAG: hypothetical protein LUG89_03965 [Methanosphaera sp.]|nr:hypothetical protein [Methanosphaera sp.]
MNIKLDKKIYLVIPIFIAFILALILTTRSSWPISWDIYIHINYALTYINNGLTNIDPLLNAPGGKEIGYMPLFHILLILVSLITQTSLIDVARILQVVLPVAGVSLIVYISYKLSGRVAALGSGLLLVSSFIFTRMYMPIPESVAILFFISGIYLYYQSTINNNYKYAIVSGLLSLVVLVTHESSFIYYLILLTALMIIECIMQRTHRPLDYYMYSMVSIIFLFICALFVLLIVSPSSITKVFSAVMTIISDPMSLFSGQVAMGLERYIKCIGIIPIIFGLIGFYYSAKKKEMLFISCWTILAFILSNLHWFGIPVHTYRMLIYVIMPGVLIGGYGFSCLVEKLGERNNNYGIILLILLIISAVGFGYSGINDSSTQNSAASTEYSTYQIAPPTSDEEEVIEWFATEDTNNKSILINNLFFGTVISSVDEIPMHYNFDVYINMSQKDTAINSLNKDNIGYIVYDKELVVNNTTEYNNLSVIKVNGSFYPSYYFTKEITDDNFNQIKIKNTEKVFENNRFIICKVN